MKHWSHFEVEAIVEDYLSMLASELSGTPYNKTTHRKALQARLNGRSDTSIEFKHANISAVLLNTGFPYINGYKPRSNYQSLLAKVVLKRLSESGNLLDLAAADAERPIVMPEVDDLLAILTRRPAGDFEKFRVSEPRLTEPRLMTNFIERESRNRSLGLAGELLVINFERARLILAGKEALAVQIEHTSRVRGDHEGYDILSYEETGAERLIEVKTTKYGAETPFFLTPNEISLSEIRSSSYQLYRLYLFRESPKLYIIPGAITTSCVLSPATFIAMPR